MYFAHASTPSTEPWNRPGRIGEPVSAITLTVIVVGLTPTSVALSGVVLHTSEVVAFGGAVDPGVEVAVDDRLPAAARRREQHHDEQDSDPAEAPQGSPSLPCGPPI